jgi:hypothetical protein
MKWNLSGFWFGFEIDGNDVILQGYDDHFEFGAYELAGR